MRFSGFSVGTDRPRSARRPRLYRRPRDRRSARLGLESLEGRALMAAGALNTAFGTHGVVTTGVRGSGNDQAAIVSVLPSGKILAAGDTAYSSSNDVLSLARYSANGTLDASFGTGGRVLTDFMPGSFLEQTSVTGLAIQPDGKYVVAATLTGYDANFNYVSQIALARYLPNGSLDTSFGNGGEVLSEAFLTTDAYGNVYCDGAHGVALMPNGDIVVSGAEVLPDASGNYGDVVALAYFTKSGALDTSMASQGVVTTAIAGQQAGGNDIVGLPGGFVLVGATAISDANQVGSYDVLAYDPHGQLISGFGNGGVASSTIANGPAGSYGNDGLGNTNRVGHIAVGPLGTIDVTGTDYYQDSNGLSRTAYAVVQFTPWGTANPLFGQGTGSVVIPSDAAGYSPSPALAVSWDGSIVVAGTAVNDGSSSSPSTAEDFQVTRLLPWGALDPTFGNGGTVTTDFAGQSDYAEAVAVQPNGRIVVTGSAVETDPVTQETSSDYALARYQPNGTLDKSFGKGGKATTDFYGASADYLAGIVVQRNGQFVAAGSSTIGPGVGLIQGMSIDLVRYNADGSLDTSFGNNGRIFTQIASPGSAPGSYDTLNAEAAVQQSDGKILVVGYDQTNQDLLAIRYNANGTRDATFGQGGIVLEPVGWGASSVVIQPNGQIVLAGTDFSTGDPAAAADIALMRLNANGTPDTTFGSGGEVLTNVAGGYDFAGGVALQSTGAIVVVGSIGSPYPFGGDAAVLRYTQTGALDTTFGSGGIVDLAASGFTGPTSVVVQPNDQILVGGSANGATDIDLAVARLNADGSLDTSFGGSSTGIALADFGYQAVANALTLQLDGSIVAVGETTDPNTYVTSFAVARFTPSGLLDSTFGTGGEVVVGFDGQNALALAVALQSNGNILVAGDANSDLGDVDFAIVCLLGGVKPSH